MDEMQGGVQVSFESHAYPWSLSLCCHTDKSINQPQDIHVCFNIVFVTTVVKNLQHVVTHLINIYAKDPQLPNECHVAYYPPHFSLHEISPTSLVFPIIQQLPDQ